MCIVVDPYRLSEYYKNEFSMQAPLLFSENEVDASALRLLDDAQVSQLIPAIGPQAKFKKSLSAWKVSLEKVI